MRLIGREKLGHLQNHDEPTEKWVRAWIAELVHANWKHPVDVSHQFPNARHEGDGEFLFPVSYSNCVIHVLIAFPQGIALVTGFEIER